MGVFSTGGIGIDPGSANLTICLENEGVVLREPSLVLSLRDDTDQVLAVGRDARQMLGRTPRDVALLSPVMDGAVGDVKLATLLMQTLTEKALGRKRPLERNKLAVSMSQGATRVEREALEKAVIGAGARRGCIVRSTIAAALGAGVDIEDAKGMLMVLIGAATTEVAVLSMHGIAAARSARTGSLAFDEAIIRWIRREKGLIIGQRTAEDLKLDIGSAVAPEDTEEVILRGRDAATGKPSTVRITPADIFSAISPQIEILLETVREAFENTPPELAGDIVERGITLSGGGALLTGLKDRLSRILGLPVFLGDEPQDDVAKGLCQVASDERLARKITQTGCLIEV